MNSSGLECERPTKQILNFWATIQYSEKTQHVKAYAEPCKMQVWFMCGQFSYLNLLALHISSLLHQTVSLSRLRQCPLERGHCLAPHQGHKTTFSPHDLLWPCR
mmetsp:Transcript_50448/g.90573  ORF Transcript_50448/g.90573 Transcript_50448/m.90573 type:complete len:104 (+) Transcript_50448:297-608(+)